ncbi:MAG: DUF1553 domain-containing protein, partial [Verrucomicrobiota bacterium]
MRVILFASLISVSSIWANDDPKQIEFFEAKIRPVLVEHCYQCHSQEAKENNKLKGGLYLDSRDATRVGGDTGSAVVPGDLKKSLLLTALRYEDDFEMPPKTQLPKNVIADFEKWIKAGAADPRDGKGVVRDEIDMEKGRQFWAFQPLEKPDGKTDIDGLIAAKLAEKKLKPVSAAAPGVLVRRIYFDLIGLPPSPADLEKWTDKIAKDEDAFGDLVDELLASPQFGERWGRHWLDVARYAESNGNSRNATFPHAWRYRDYVIDAFNADTPFDRFLTEQLAGDLLPHNGVDEQNRNLVATGFLALGSKPVIRNRRGAFVPDIADDQIEVTSRAFMALTVSCARCHDHKFDPIPTTDYYGLAGIFASSETLYGGGSGNMNGAPATPLHMLADEDPDMLKKYDAWREENKKIAASLKKLNDQAKKLRPRKQKGKPAKQPSDADKKKLANLNDEIKKLQAKQKQIRNNPPPKPSEAMGIREAEKVTEVPVYVRGETPKGQPVDRRFVTAAFGEDAPSFADQQSGRLELANWLTSEENPLTARVMVNRIWLHMFGDGIVRTPDNFGVNGERPSHPQLLDHLAAEFRDGGWSVKKMIRRIALTHAYRRSDAHDDTNFEVDPDNIYVWRHSRKRLEAEAIRDAILAVSGNLNPERPVGSVVTQHGGKLIQDGLTPDKIHEPSNHRSVYLAMLRNGLPEALEVFDVADPSLVVGRRNTTTVPAQDLFMMNNPFVSENAEAMARQLL